jgi:3-oxoacyl-[acyl-carrier protein] reductase
VDLALRDSCALVCAASKGLGRAAATSLALEGARVAICGRTAETLHAAAAAIRVETGAEVVPIVADVASASDVERLVPEAVRALGGLDILVTNTGGPKSVPFESLTDADWSAAIESIFMSVVRLSRAAVPPMRARGGGRLIFVTSVSVKQPIEALALSNALRAGITGLAKTLAIELAADNILVNCVAPGYTRTDRVVELAAAAAHREHTTITAVQKRTEQMIPLARLATVEEFGDVVAFLASAKASYVTGTTIQVDGGYVKGLL